MKVAFVHTDFRIYWPARLKALNTFLTNRGIVFFVIEISGTGSPYYFEQGGNDHPDFWHCLFPGKRMEEISAFSANKALRKKLDELQPDIVFSGAIAFSSGAASTRWANETGRKCVIFDNARLQDVPRGRWINFLKKMVYSGVDAILCPAPPWNDTYHFFGFNDSQIFYGLNVVDNSFWLKTSGNHNPELPDKYFLSVGRQIPKKNFLFLLKSYKDYCRKNSDPADLVLVGNGPKRKILEEFIKENGLKVHLLDFTTQDDLRSIYHNALCFILPSRYGETWGLVVNEAMASGLPVLVSHQVGCASTLVKEGVNGFSFSPDNQEELSELMSLITALPAEKFAEMSQNSAEIIRNWGLERFCSGADDALHYVLNNPHRKPGSLSRMFIRLWRGRYRPV